MKSLRRLFRALRLNHTSNLVFLGLFLVSGVVAIFTLRNNNLTMIHLRDQVYLADRSNTDVNGALTKLQQYVFTHMNTSLTSGGNTIYPPIQLKDTYDRLQAAEKKRVDSVNSQVYTNAQRYCEKLDPVSFYGRNRIPCVKNYIASHGIKAQAIPAALYQFDFVSPHWSPDLAGWSLAVASVSLVGFVTSYFYNRKWHSPAELLAESE